MYIYAPNGAAETFPYSIGELRRDNPNISCPKRPSDELLASYDVFPVVTADMPSYNRITHDLTESTPELIDGAWTQQWSVIAVSESEVVERTAEVAEQARLDRDNLLKQSDWRAIKSQEPGASISQAWNDYRQALRDVPQQAGFPSTITWPTKPE